MDTAQTSRDSKLDAVQFSAHLRDTGTVLKIMQGMAISFFPIALLIGLAEAHIFRTAAMTGVSVIMGIDGLLLAAIIVTMVWRDFRGTLTES